MYNTTVYESARDFSKRKILSERQTRQMIEAGKVPGIQTAKGFKVNVELFLEQLETQSRENVRGGIAI